jgi:hypothetical protein
MPSHRQGHTSYQEMVEMAIQRKSQEIQLTIKVTNRANDRAVRDLIGRLLMKELKLSPQTGGIFLSIIDEVHRGDSRSS